MQIWSRNTPESSPNETFEVHRVVRQLCSEQGSGLNKWARANQAKDLIAASIYDKYSGLAKITTPMDDIIVKQHLVQIGRTDGLTQYSS